MFDAIIIGAGPAGMMAAIRAAQRGKKALLIERGDSPGKKLIISGNSRCNLTNSCNISEFLKNFSSTRDFLRNAFAKFFNTELISFFETAGVRLKTEEDGRVFPASGKSSDILNCLIQKLKNLNVTFLTNERVRDVIIKNKKIEGVLTYSGRRLPAQNIVIATGGLSYPETGSTGDGYTIAKRLGHTIIPLKPALSGILIKEKFIRDWQGISLKDIGLTLFSAGKKSAESFGDIVFTHFGISGPVPLDISGAVYDALQMKNDAIIAVNFKPEKDHKAMNDFLLGEFKLNPGKTIKSILKTLLTQKMITRFLKHCRIEQDKRVSQITSAERKRLIGGLLEFKLTAQGVMPVKTSIITRGGVSTKEINPRTMESKLIKGLFFAGEVIDIDARTGGYNMQAAFSTGFSCGDSV